MKIALIAPRNSKCGIATYSTLLFDSLSKSINVEFITLPEIKTKKDLFSLIKHITCFNLDLVHIQHAPGLFGGDRAGTENFRFLVDNLNTKIAVTLHEFGRGKRLYSCGLDRFLYNFKAFVYNHFFYNLNQNKFIKILSRFDKIIVHNKCQSSQLKDSNHALGNKISVIPHGIVINTYDYSVKQNLKNKPEFKDKFILTSFGFVKQFKNYELLINLLTELPANIIYIIAGGPQDEIDDIYVKYLKRLVNKLRLENRVIFTGFLTDKEVCNYVIMADLMVFPYKTLTASGALSYSLGFGKAVLASKLEATKEILENNPGVIEVFSSNGELKEKIISFYSNSSKLIEFENRAKEYSKRFSFDNIAQATIHVYKELVPN